jgi:pimeloyl-[acyl-carrier protein] methyl ester esterase
VGTYTGSTEGFTISERGHRQQIVLGSMKTNITNRSDDIELVFLPGLDGTGLSYGPLGEVMPEGVRVTVVHYPADRKLSFGELVQCAYGQLPRNKPLVLIAESFSGPITISLASSFPSHIKGIVFCATFMKFDRPFLLGQTKYIPFEYLLRKPMPNFLLFFLVGGKPFSDRLAPLFRQLEKLVKPEVMAHRIRMLKDIDATSDAQTLSLPCCYIKGAQDKLLPARCHVHFKKYLPDLIVKSVDGPHGILQARPEQCAEIIMDFVKSLSESRNE